MLDIGSFYVTPTMRSNRLEGSAGVVQLPHLFWRAEPLCIAVGEDRIDGTGMPHECFGACIAQSLPAAFR